MNTAIHGEVTTGETDDLFGRASHRNPMLHLPVRSVGRDSMSYDGYFANKAANRDRTILMALCLYDTTKSTNVDHEALMIDAIDGRNSDPDPDDDGFRCEEDGSYIRYVPRSNDIDTDEPVRILRNPEYRQVRMVLSNTSGQFWLQHTTTRIKYNEIEIEGHDCLTEEPVFSMQTKQPAKRLPPRVLRTLVLKETASSQKPFTKWGIRCATPGCNTDFMIPKNAPNAKVCPACHRKELHARRQESVMYQEPAPMSSPKSNAASTPAPRTTRAQDEILVRDAVKKGCVPQGARITSGGLDFVDRQVTVVYNGHSFTIHHQRAKSSSGRARHALQSILR